MIQQHTSTKVLARQTMLSRTTILAALCVSAVALGADPVRQDIFTPSARFPCFRQPAILGGASADVVLAFAENRNVSACDPAAAAVAATAPAALKGGPVPNEIGSLQLRRSLDGGATWGAMQSLFVGNIDFYTPVRDAASGRLFLFLQVAGEKKPLVKLLTSDTDGATWHPPADFALAGGVPAPYSPTNLKPAVGHGLQLAADMCNGGGGGGGGGGKGKGKGKGRGAAKCADAGRMLVPFCCVNGTSQGDKGTNLGYHSCALLSDDGGASWRLGGFGQPGTRESMMVQTPSPNGSSAVYLNERNFGLAPGHRLTARSADGGASFGQYAEDAALVTPVTAHWTGIVGAVARLAGAPDGASRIAYAGPANGTARATMAVRLSADEAHTWAAPRVVWEGPAAYSDLVPLSGGDLGMLFENGDDSFADRVSFVRLGLDWLLKK